MSNAEDSENSWDEGSLSGSLDPEVNYSLEPSERMRIRGQFLEAIRTDAPEVLTSLRARVHRLSPQNRTKCEHVSNPLERWAEDFRLYESTLYAGDWILKAALKTLHYWDEHPDQGVPPAWSPDAVEVDPEEPDNFGPRDNRRSSAIRSMCETPFRFEHERWNPFEVDQHTYAEQIREEFEKTLKDELERIKGMLCDPWSTPAPKKREDEHFRWLVLCQVKGWSYVRIASTPRTAKTAKQETVDFRAVSDAIKTTAQLLFGDRWKVWRDLRPRRPGRPRTNPQSSTGSDHEEEDDEDELPTT
jgi:hypothetical protein